MQAILFFIFAILVSVNVTTYWNLFLATPTPIEIPTINNFVTFISRTNLAIGLGCLLRTYLVMLLFKKPDPLNEVDLVYILYAFGSLIFGYVGISEYWKTKLKKVTS